MNRIRQLVGRARARVREVLVRGVFSTLEKLLPVDRRLWCFCTWGRYPHTVDNPRAVFEKVKNDPSIRKVVLTRSCLPPEVAADGIDVHIVEAESLRGMYYLARSRVVVIGYALMAMCSYSRYLTAKHVVVQLSHGIVLRRVGRLCEGEGWWSAETPLYAATMSSTERDREIMREAYSPIPPERVWLTGLPRNDFILGEESELPEDYRRTLADLRARIGERRLVLYAPTWRQEGRALYAFSKEEVAALERLLGDHGAVLGIRGHSNVREHASYTRDYRSSRILSMNDVPDVNVLLRLTDVLVTDYSSIYLDFLLTQRPIVHFAYDLREYRSERGFLYDLEEAFAGPAPETFTALLAHLEEALSDPAAHLPTRRRVRRLFHAHPDGSAQAVADRIRRLVGPTRTAAAPSAPPGAGTTARRAAPEMKA